MLDRCVDVDSVNLIHMMPQRVDMGLMWTFVGCEDWGGDILSELGDL